jgi:hypothetical protein
VNPVEVRAGRKACTRCGEWKLLEQFYSRRSGSGRQSTCRECERARRAASSEDHKAYTRAHYLANRRRYLDYGLANYGLTRAGYLALLAAQDGLCALCRRAETTLNRSGEIRELAVDHDHACCPGKKSCGECIRGLLCHHCNTGLGAFGDSVARLLQASDYLTRRRGAQLEMVN